MNFTNNINKALFYIGPAKLTKVVSALVVSVLALVSAKMPVGAQTIGTSISADTSIGKINSLNSLFYWIINFMKYVGWAGVLIGVFIVLALLVYKLISGDDTETMKKVQNGITRAIIIIVIGILLLGGSFIIDQVGKLVGLSVSVSLESGQWAGEGGT